MERPFREFRWRCRTGSWTWRIVGLPWAHTSGKLHFIRSLPNSIAVSSSMGVLNLTAFLHAFFIIITTLLTRWASNRRIDGGAYRGLFIWVGFTLIRLSTYSMKSSNVVANPSMEGTVYINDNLRHPILHTIKTAPFPLPFPSFLSPDCIFRRSIRYPQKHRSFCSRQAVWIWVGVSFSSTNGVARDTGITTDWGSCMSWQRYRSRLTRSCAACYSNEKNECNPILHNMMICNNKVI